MLEGRMMYPNTHAHGLAGRAARVPPKLSSLGVSAMQ